MITKHTIHKDPKIMKLHDHTEPLQQISIVHFTNQQASQITLVITLKFTHTSHHHLKNILNAVTHKILLPS